MKRAHEDLDATAIGCGSGDAVPQTTLLLIEDDALLAQLMMTRLLAEGYAINHADNGNDGMRLAATGRYDVMIVDRMLPDAQDGLTIVQALRDMNNTTPILILSALAGIDDLVGGLKAGGDDYLAKPFVFPELLARLEALVRRARRWTASTEIVMGDLFLDSNSRYASYAGVPIELLPREFKLLEFLMRHANRVVTKAMLLENVWNYHFDPRTNVVEVHVSKLRKKLASHGVRNMLKTVRNNGYMLTEDA